MMCGFATDSVCTAQSSGSPEYAVLAPFIILAFSGEMLFLSGYDRGGPLASAHCCEVVPPGHMKINEPENQNL